MLRPGEFTHPHLTVNIAPYQIINSPNDAPERGDSNGGVFHRGQLIWTQETPRPFAELQAAVGYVDGLGHVLIDPRVLKRAEQAVAV
jgi:hypothetical protein